MTATMTTSGIDKLSVESLASFGWAIRFRSDNSGMHHQLYVNGRLADATDTPEQRCFICPDSPAPLGIRVVAVSAADRMADLAHELPAQDRCAGWIYRPRVLRSAPARDGERLEILTDHTSGQVSDVPLASAEVWPAWLPRWAFGQELFGLGGFGYGGCGAAGLGEAAFGAGPFGIEAGLMDVEAELLEEGTHQIVLRARRADGQQADSAPVHVNASPPPLAPSALEVVSYDQQTHQLELQIT